MKQSCQIELFFALFIEKFFTFTVFVFFGLQSGPLFRDEKGAHIDALKLKEANLALDTAAVARQTAARPHHTVAGYHQRDRVMPHRTADRLCGHLFDPTPPCSMLPL